MKRVRLVALVLMVAATVLQGIGYSNPGACTDDGRSGGDWPMLGGDLFATNNQHAEDQIDPTTVAGLQLAWQTPANTGFQSVPVVAGNCVYITSVGFIQAHDLASGSLMWKSSEPLPARQYQPFALAVADGRVHVNYDNDLAPRSAAFDADTGAFLWASEPITFGYPAWQLSSAVVFNGMQLMHTTGPDFDPLARPGYAIFDATSGATLHSQMTVPQRDVDQGYAGGGVWGTPSVDVESGYAFVGTANPYSRTKEHRYDNAVIKIDVDSNRATFGQIVDFHKGQSDSVVDGLGNQPVCRQFAEESQVFLVNPYCVMLDVEFGTGPAMWRNHNGELMLGIMQKSGLLHVLYADTMARAWSLQLGTNSALTLTGGNHGPVATDGERLYVTANPGTLWVLDAETGAIEWITPVLGYHNQSLNIAIANGVVYTSGAVGVRALDAATGARLWEYARPGYRSECASEAGGISIAHHTVLINCNGVVMAFRLPS